MEEKNEIKTTCFEVRNSERDSLAIPADLARCKESVKNSSKADVSMESDNTTYGTHGSIEDTGLKIRSSERKILS